jgi:hypothetical protein
MAKDPRIGITGGGAGRGASVNNSTAALKKSGLEKLAKINRTKIESDISFALRHGKITKQEAAAIDPKKFGILLNPNIVSSKTITLKKGK